MATIQTIRSLKIKDIVDNDQNYNDTVGNIFQKIKEDFADITQTSLSLEEYHQVYRNFENWNLEHGDFFEQYLQKKFCQADVAKYAKPKLQIT